MIQYLSAHLSRDIDRTFQQQQAMIRAREVTRLFQAVNYGKSGSRFLIGAFAQVARRDVAPFPLMDFRDVAIRLE